jgi:hypothetical protein
MNIPIKLGAACMVALFLFAGAEAYAADAEGSWETTVAPYVWFAGISGDITVDGIPSRINESFSDISKYLDFGGMLFVESRKDRVAILLNTAYIKLSDSSILVKENMTESITELGLAYQILGPESGPGLALDVLGGGRYWYMKSEINLFGTINLSGRQDWIDPFVGARVRWGLTKNLLLVVQGDVGGFNVGSDSSWQAVGTIVYGFSDWFGVGAGYRALYDHYENGGYLDKFEYNATMKGPFIGVAFVF